MNNFIFENSTKIYFGKNAVKEHLIKVLSNYGNNIMLAYGENSIKNNGIYDEVTTILKKANKNIVEFSGIMSNPTYKKVLEGKKVAIENHIDIILGVGGGSVMDCCKAISLAVKHQGDIWQDFYKNIGIVNFDPLPFGVIVTVAGTGSEMNGGAVITNTDLNIKTGRDYPKCNPKFAIMNPEYTYSVSKLQTASGGFDILSHIMETYFSEPNDDNISDGISEVLMKTIIENLPKALKTPNDYEARSNLMWASTMAENRIIKLGKKMDFEVHQIEHQLSAFTNCNHGIGLAILQPTYYRHIYQYGLSKFVKFAQNVWNVTDNLPNEQIALLGIEKLENYIHNIGLPNKLSQIGLENINLKEIAYSCNISQGSYKLMTHQEILEILENCK